MTDRRRAPTEVLERLAEAVSEQVRIVHECSSIEVEARVRQWDECRRLVSAYRAAVAPLRTRAAVDAEIVRTIRAIGSRGGPHMAAELHPTTADLQRLVALRDEPTAPEAEPEPDRYSARDEAAIAEQTHLTSCLSCRSPGVPCSDEWCSRSGCIPCGHGRRSL